MSAGWAAVAGVLAGGAGWVGVGARRGPVRSVRFGRPGGSVRSVRLRSRGARPAGLTAADVAGLAEQLAALSRAGLPAERSWPALAEHAASEGVRGAARAVVAGGRAGLTPARALRAHAAGRQADASLHRLVVALDVSERTGSGRAQALAQLAASLRADADAAAEREAALAGPRATAGLLAVLPLAGLGLGALLGARPWAVLLGTGPGRLCLVAGCACWIAGRLWTRRLVRSASC